jgi:cytochrome P450
VLALLVRSAQAEGKPLDDQQLRDQLFTLFFAGHETSATALCWVHYLLARNASVRERLFREVESVLGDRPPTPEDLEALTYTHQVVQESLRLYSPIHSLSRVATVDSLLGGYRIPAGATVCVSMYAVHRLPQYWPDPERFDPERFTPEQCAARPRFAYLPFAAGHRNCIGGGQAILELKMIVAQIAQRYRLELAAGQKIERAAGTTMYPRYGMRMTIQHRSTRDQG